MKQNIKFLIALICSLNFIHLHADEYKDFVILIASYNNEQYAVKNIISAFQNYPEEHYKIIFIDDCSEDKTLEVVENVINNYKKQHIVMLFHNTERKGALYNHYHSIHGYINDKTIVVILDGDDHLADENVLSYLNEIYSNNDIWLTYGQFKHSNRGQIGFCRPMPDNIVKNNSFRAWVHIPSHLRTFYAKLYKNIKREDLTFNGEFFEMCADMATMIPMIEQARDHFKFIPTVLYHYNDNNSISDHRKNGKLQKEIDIYVRGLLPYKPLEALF